MSHLAVAEAIIALKEENKLLREIAAPILCAAQTRIDQTNDGLQTPWWAIAFKGIKGAFQTVGPFFSREDAERHRQARLYEYGEKSVVYGFSGCYSRKYAMALQKAVEFLEQQEITKGENHD